MWETYNLMLCFSQILRYIIKRCFIFENMIPILPSIGIKAEYVDVIKRKHFPRYWPFVPVTGEFPAQMASNAENVSIRWRHHGTLCSRRHFQMHSIGRNFLLTGSTLTIFFPKIVLKLWISAIWHMYLLIMKNCLIHTSACFALIMHLLSIRATIPIISVGVTLFAFQFTKYNDIVFFVSINFLMSVTISPKVQRYRL